MTTFEIGKKLVELCNAGKNEEAMKTLYSEDIISVEAAGDTREVKGIAAVAKQGAEWFAAHTVHSAKTEGPFPNGAKFAVVHDYDITQKASGNRVQFREIAVYTVKNDKIVHEEFMYPTGP